jgi:spermidine synthase
MATDVDAPAPAPEHTSHIVRSWGRSHLDLFIVSFLILFLELACIRWFGATVQFLTFFTNLVLLACFLGMSVGLMTAGRRQNLIELVLPLALLAVTMAAGLASTRVSRQIAVDVGAQKTAQEVFFGTEPAFAGDLDTSKWVVPVEALAGLFFVLIALTFVGLGQAMGRAFDAIPDRVAAYTADVLGSLTGIAAFGVMSWLRTPPEVWFAVAAVGVLWFLPRLTMMQAGSAVALVAAVAFWGYREGTTKAVIWSPYYKVHYHEKDARLVTNNIGHQQMVDVAETGGAYHLPHLLNRDAGRPAFAQVMVIGAGSGNDVAAALANGAEHVDAVEIEPVLNEIGRNDHPRRPYSDSRVSIHLDDGRSFLRKTRRKYDMIEYALVDSLVLHSGYSSLRLESFLFTDQAFRDVKERLDDDGVFIMCNYYRQGWIVGRLAAMARNVFGADPIVINLPYRDAVRPDQPLLGDNFTFVVAGKAGSKSLEAIRARFEADKFFWLNGKPAFNRAVNAYGPEKPKLAASPPDWWQKIGPAKVETAGVGPLPSDDWPFLYLRESRIPGLNFRGMALVAVLSLVILQAFAPVTTVRPNARMFFLGAGFMLLETKGVVHLSLLFGSTWVVNSVVFFSILVMILLSNLFVLWRKPGSLKPYYTGLVVALLVNALVPMDVFLALPGAGKVAASCLVVFVPIFFAGVIFASSFAASERPDVDFGSNVAGVILGGLSENMSLVLGFDLVLLLAIGYYILSAVLGPRLGARAA